jgi:DNA-binding XRE family transcriptional regulator
MGSPVYSGVQHVRGWRGSTGASLRHDAPTVPVSTGSNSLSTEVELNGQIVICSVTVTPPPRLRWPTPGSEDAWGAREFSIKECSRVAMSTSIRVARLRRGLNQEQVAKGSGVSRPVVVRAEAGHHVHPSSLARLLRFLDSVPELPLIDGAIGSAEAS